MVVSLYQSEYESLRTLLRSMRMSAGFTQSQLAVALGVGQSYVSKIERGENFVDVLLFAKWCGVCGVQAGAALDSLHLDGTEVNEPGLGASAGDMASGS
ncbi:MAG: XRE family transcriptional regulator [Comamonadaceae bacterium]|nr:MAG: XRE family transcriptional regulator [Comamonadaceae bacterium]